MSLKQMQALEQGLKPEPMKVMGFDCVCGRRMVVESDNGVVASPPKREWQGLTDDEMQKIIKLVAKKCAEIADTAEPYQSADLIRKHFGVENDHT